MGFYTEQLKVDYVIEHFHDTPNKDLAQAIGVRRSTITNIATQYRLKKDKAHLRKMHSYVGKLAGNHFSTELQPSREKVIQRSQKWLEKYKLERARKVFGLPAKTKIRVQIGPRTANNQRTYLRSRGYIIERLGRIAYSDDATRRSPKIEKTSKYFDFKPFINNSNM